MVAENEVYGAVQSLEDLVVFAGPAETEIPQVEDYSVLGYDGIPVFNQSFVHLIRRSERPVGICYYVVVTEMGV